MKSQIIRRGLLRLAFQRVALVGNIQCRHKSNQWIFFVVMACVEICAFFLQQIIFAERLCYCDGYFSLYLPTSVVFVQTPLFCCKYLVTKHTKVSYLSNVVGKINQATSLIWNKRLVLTHSSYRGNVKMLLQQSGSGPLCVITCVVLFSSSQAPFIWR